MDKVWKRLEDAVWEWFDSELLPVVLATIVCAAFVAALWWAHAHG